MTILVTGGNGILGTPLINTLLKRNHQVIGLCRTPPESDREGLRWLTGDVSLPRLGLRDEEWQLLVRDVSAIFHLAARTDFKGRTLAEYFPVNVDGVRHIKELALATGAWLHHVSTAFVCGDWSGEFREDQLKAGQKFHNYYEESKYLGECVLREEPVVRFSVYRPAIILERQPTAASHAAFGPFVFLDGVFRICLSLAKQHEAMETLRVAGNPKAHLPFIFDDEAAQTLCDLAMHKGEQSKTYHLTPQSPFPNQLLEQVFNQAFGRQAVVMQKPRLIQDQPQSRAERILAKKTSMYAPYMNLATTFSRTNLNQVEPRALPPIGEDSLLTAFSLFLATKKELQQVVSHDETFHLQHYFNHFLALHLGRPLIKNLASLTACLQVEITGYSTWTISLDRGVLTRVEEGGFGQFGYTTDAHTFLQVASGQLSPQQGFFKGNIQLVANPKEALRTATALEEFFKEYPYRLPRQDQHST
jgi:nucleoside-diphosphate-sugar epimerase